MSDEEGICFLASFSGQIESVCFPGGKADDELFFRYDIVSGPDWELIGGVDGGLSQYSTRGDSFQEVAFGMPIDVSFKSTTPFGWPQIVISVYGISSWGVEAAKGYGRTHLPAGTGPRTLRIPLAAPRPPTALAELMARLLAKAPQILNPSILAQGNDNYLLRTRSYGHVNITVSLLTKGFKSSGYDNVPGYTLATTESKDL